MDLTLLAHLLGRRRTWAERDRWSRQQLLAHQSEQLRLLRSHALARSRLYQRLHKGREDSPLTQLPPVTKEMLMAHWDEAVTAPGLSLERVRSWLSDAVETRRAPRGWYSARTGGTTGSPGVFVWDKHEWLDVVTSYGRANEWAHVRVDLRHPLRTAIVSSHDPTHVSAVVGRSLKSPLVPTLQLDAGDSLESQVRAIEHFKPRLLVGYASALLTLASARLSGAMESVRLDGIVSASEVLSPGAKSLIQDAWNAPVFDVYAATETAAIASPCWAGTSHVYEDLLILEPVDDDFAPVPVGEPGAQLLATVLFSRTLPLIRYVLDDRVAIGPPGCRCGRPHATLAGVEGRSQDVLMLPTPSGTYAEINPIVIHHALDDVTKGAWQVEWNGNELQVAVSNPAVETELVANALRHELDRHNVDVRVHAFHVGQLSRTRLSKVRLITDSTRRG